MTRKPNKKIGTKRSKAVERFLEDKDNKTALQNVIRKIAGQIKLPNALDTRAEVWQEVYRVVLASWEEFSTSDDQLGFVTGLTRTVAQRKEFVRPPTEYSSASPVKLNGDVSISVQATTGLPPDPDPNLSRGMAGKNFYVRTNARLYCPAHPTCPNPPHKDKETQAVTEIVQVQRLTRDVPRNPFTKRKTRPVKVEVCTVRLQCGCTRTVDFNKTWAGKRTAADRLDLAPVSNERDHRRALVKHGTAVDTTYEVYDHEAEDGVLTVELNESVEGRIDSHIEPEPELETMSGLVDRVDDIDAGENNDEIGKSSTCCRRPNFRLVTREEARMLDRIQRQRDGKAVWDESPIACMGQVHRELPDDIMTDYEIAATVLGFDIDWFWTYRWETAQSGGEVRSQAERDRYSAMNDRIAAYCAVSNRNWLRKAA